MPARPLGRRRTPGSVSHADGKPQTQRGYPGPQFTGSQLDTTSFQENSGAQAEPPASERRFDRVDC